MSLDQTRTQLWTSDGRAERSGGESAGTACEFAADVRMLFLKSQSEGRLRYKDSINSINSFSSNITNRKKHPSCQQYEHST